MSKDNEKGYVAFRREHTEPIDKYTRREVDEKISRLNARFEERINEVKKELMKQYDATLASMIQSWTKRIEGIEGRLKDCYTQEKIDTFFHVLKQKADFNEKGIVVMEDKFGHLEDYVLGNIKKKWWKK